jgi:hypothetical protein
MGGAPYWSTPHAFFTAPQYEFLVQQAGPSFTLPPPQQSPSSTSWFGQWDCQSLTGCLSSTAPAPPTPVTDRVVDSGATNRTPPHPGHIFTPRPPSLAHPSSIVVGNGSVLLVTSVGDSVLPRPFYLNDVLVAPDLIQSLLFVRRFTTNNSYSMEFDPFALSVKDLATKRVLARYGSTDLLYTLPLPTLPTTTPRVIPYTLAVTASSATWHRRLGHPGPDVLFKLSSTSAITCPRGRDDSLCHACQLGRHVRLPFPSSSTRVLQFFDLVHCDIWTSHVLSVSGYKYYLVILDDCTHYSWTFPLRQKSDTFPTLSHFFAFVSTQFGRTIRSV